MNLFNINDLFASIGILGFIDSVREPLMGIWMFLVKMPGLGTVLNFFEELFGSGATPV
jgi:hypothetical protein